MTELKLSEIEKLVPENKDNNKSIKRLNSLRYRENNRELRRETDRIAFKKRYQKIKLTRDYTSEKSRARDKLRQAVLYKKIHKPDVCEMCKKNFPKAKIHGHHKDYSKPLEVEWLCSICHGIIHRQHLASNLDKWMVEKK